MLHVDMRDTAFRPNFSTWVFENSKHALDSVAIMLVNGGRSDPELALTPSDCRCKVHGSGTRSSALEGTVLVALLTRPDHKLYRWLTPKYRDCLSLECKLKLIEPQNCPLAWSAIPFTLRLSFRSGCRHCSSILPRPGNCSLSACKLRHGERTH